MYQESDLKNKSDYRSRTQMNDVVDDVISLKNKELPNQDISVTQSTLILKQLNLFCLKENIYMLRMLENKDGYFLHKQLSISEKR